jgi:lipopolysaccharide export system permease protein
MLKKIDQYILKAFAGPFVLTFFITLFILLMQFLWKYIDDLVGKGLDWYIVAELLFYASATMVPLAIPLAVLLSSLMVFGNLGEKFELAALKSSGIGMFRFMSPSIVAAVFISLGAFLFSNYIMPRAFLKYSTRLIDITQKKPALNIKPNVFYEDIEHYAILIKSKDEDEVTVHDVTIYDKSMRNGYPQTLVAEKAEMRSSPSGDALIMRLYNGVRYQREATKQGKDAKPVVEHTRMFFKEWETALDLSGLKLNQTSEEVYETHYKMLNQGQLKKAIDSLQRATYKRMESLKPVVASQFWFSRDTIAKTNLKKKYEKKSKATDSLKAIADSDEQTNGLGKVMHSKAANQKQISVDSAWTAMGMDSRQKLGFEAGQFVSLLSDKDANGAISRALVGARNVANYTRQLHDHSKYSNKRITLHWVEWHRKISLSVSCLVFLFVGAPLGAIIRKGGFGMPVITSVLIFIAFFVLYIAGDKMASEGIWSAVFGMWFANLVIFPFSIWLTIKAKNDSPLLNAEVWRERRQWLLGLVFRRKKMAAGQVG